MTLDPTAATAAEVARVNGVAESTVRSWRDKGLPCKVKNKVEVYDLKTVVEWRVESALESERAGRSVISEDAGDEEIARQALRDVARCGTYAQRVGAAKGLFSVAKQRAIKENAGNVISFIRLESVGDNVEWRGAGSLCCPTCKNRIELKPGDLKPVKKKRRAPTSRKRSRKGAKS